MWCPERKIIMESCQKHTGANMKSLHSPKVGEFESNKKNNNQNTEYIWISKNPMSSQWKRQQKTLTNNKTTTYWSKGAPIYKSDIWPLTMWLIICNDSHNKTIWTKTNQP